MITFILAVCGNVDYVYTFPLSPPSRAAWIEIVSERVAQIEEKSRRLHGRRGLKSFFMIRPLRPRRRRLHGRRGLKYYDSMKEAEKDGVAAFTGGVD